ncbi:MAG: DUF1501 domain-containing protein [Dehalococcoidia bacterium]|nr:DUF1501 domain-containing protein [Dehalococcoidia bacterium]
MLNRRTFLKRGVVVVSAGLALPSFLTKAVYAAEQGGMAANPAFANRVFVVVQMAGGNDGLNTVVPYTSGRYRDLRRNLALAADKVLPLDNDTALHPSMTKFKELYDQGNLAVVQGVGYPNPNLSHFRSMEIWQTAHTGAPTSGWMGRYFDKVIDEDGHVLDGVAIGQGAPLALRSETSQVAVVERVDQYQIRGDGAFPKDTDSRIDALLKLYQSYPGSAPFAALLNKMPGATHQSSKKLQQAAKDYIPAVPYPETPLGTGFKTLAQAIHSGLGVQVFHIGLGGFDTHSNELGTQARLLGNLSDAMHAFYQDMAGHDRAQDVLLMTWSEFGRRAQENANNGTDHGTAGPMFLLGGNVQSGLYGQAPSLTDLDNGNLKYTVDFRSVYATVLEQWLGAPADEVLGARYERLPFVASALQANRGAQPALAAR